MRNNEHHFTRSESIRNRRPVGSPAQPPPGRETARIGRCPGDGHPGWDHHRAREHLLGADPPARGAPARHDHAPWVTTRTQPIAVDDIVRYLLGVLARPEAEGRVFEAGGPEVLRYATMLRRLAVIQRRPLPILPVPLLTPRLSSLWLSLVTDVDTATGRALVNSMTNEVIVRDPSLRDLIPFDPMPYDDAVRTALSERRQAKRGDR